MRKLNIHFHDKTFPKISLNICFLELSKEIPMDAETSSNQPR